MRYGDPVPLAPVSADLAIRERTGFADEPAKMKPPLGCDVIVAGAGPAGAAAATYVAAAGLRVIVADSRAFPRDKV